MHTTSNMNNRRTFWDGFICGMAAPMMLFTHYRAPELHKPAMSPLYRPAKNEQESLQRDMLRVGDDIRAAIRKYAAK